MPAAAHVLVAFHMPDRQRVEKTVTGGLTWEQLRAYCAEHLRASQTNYQLPRAVRLGLVLPSGAGCAPVPPEMLPQCICRVIAAGTRVQHVNVECDSA
jgi:hypothetical protein